MFKLLAGVLLATSVATSASAALVNVTGGTAANLPAAGTGAGFYDVLGPSDPWPDAGALKGITSLGLASGRTIDVTFRGNDSLLTNTVDFGGAGGFSTATSTPGVSTVTGLSTAEFEALTFNGSSLLGITSERVAVQAFGNVIEVGFNDGAPVDADFDDLRFSAVVTPVPAALPLLATGLAGLAWWGGRRRRRDAA
jgi:hypothetical protein